MAARSSVLPPEPSVVLGEDDMAYSSAPTHDELRAAASAIGAFSSSKSSRALMGELAFEKRKDKFLTKMEMVLENVLRMKIDERQLECIFVLVIQSATDYLWCSDEERRARTVQEVCTKLLKPFVKGDEKLVLQLVGFVGHRIKPATWWRRHKRAVVNFFSRLAELVSRMV